MCEGGGKADGVGGGNRPCLESVIHRRARTRLVVQGTRAEDGDGGRGDGRQRGWFMRLVLFATAVILDGDCSRRLLFDGGY